MPESHVCFMNTESPWKKNPLLNIGVLVLSIGLLTLSLLDRAQVLGASIVLIGFAMFYVGYRKAKASGAAPVPRNERRKRLCIVMASFVAGFLGSAVMVWSTISKLGVISLWVFIVGTVVFFSGLLSLFVWQYRKAGEQNK
jgi:hypothetical protein